MQKRPHCRGLTPRRRAPTVKFHTPPLYMYPLIVHAFQCLLVLTAEWLQGGSFAKQFMEEDHDFVWGSYTEGLRRHGAGSCTWFTIFRHPVARLGKLSHIEGFPAVNYRVQPQAGGGRVAISARSDPFVGTEHAGPFLAPTRPLSESANSNRMWQ